MMKLADEMKIQTVKDYAVAFGLSKWIEFSKNKKGLEYLGLDLFQEMTISMSKQKAVDTSYLQQAAPSSTIVADFQNIFLKMENSDGLAELTDGVTLPFHRAILSAHDRKLFQLLSSQKEQKTVKFPISSETFKFLLQFIYFGSCEMTVKSACEVIEEIIPKYSLEKFRLVCDETVKTQLTLESVLRVLCLCYLPINETRPLFTDTLRKDCLFFIAENFSEVNIPSIRAMHPTIAFDLLETVFAVKKSNARGAGKKNMFNNSPGSLLKKSLTFQ